MSATQSGALVMFEGVGGGGGGHVEVIPQSATMRESGDDINTMID
jgi:hypothetical protein